MRGVCDACGEAKGLIEHHVSYEPKEIVHVCRGCHTSIHASPGKFPDLAPRTVPPDRQMTTMMTSMRVSEDVRYMLLGYMEEHSLGTATEAVLHLVEEAGRDPVDLKGAWSSWQAEGLFRK